MASTSSEPEAPAPKPAPLRLTLGDPFLSGGWIAGRMNHPGHSLTVVAKAAFRLRPGEPALPLEEPIPLEGDRHHDDDDTASLAYDSDFAYFKPKADVLVVGSCYAPGGGPTTRCEASFRVGELAKRLRVHGDRHWALPFGPFSPRSAAAPFTALPLRWERAHGGGRSRHNPVGVGRRRTADAEGVLRRRLPNVERASGGILQPFQRPRPAGFGPIARSWKPRTQRMGRYRRKWRRQRWPWFPENFDWRHFNAAPVDQRVEGYLRGDEEVVLENLHADHPRYETRLPGFAVRGFVRSDADGGDAGAFREVPLVLDTLWLEAEAERAIAVWRGWTPVESDRFESLRDLFLLAEPLEQRGDAAEIERRFAAATEAPAEAPEPEPPPEPPALDAEAIAARVSAAFAELAAGAPEAVPAEIFQRPMTREQFLAAMQGVLAASHASFGGDPGAASAWTPPPAIPPEVREVLDRYGFTPPEPSEGEGRDRDAFIHRLEAGEAVAELDWSGADLRELDLSGRDLHGTLLFGTQLDGASLDGADLRDVRGAEACLRRASLRGAVLDGADFTGADLREARLGEASAERACFEGADLGEADLAGLRAPSAAFAGARLERASLAGADLSAADLSRASLLGARLASATLAGTTLEGANAPDVDWGAADLSGARLGEGARLGGGRFAGVTAPDSVWEGSVLAGAEFVDAELAGADFTAAVLDGAVFDRARLRGANFSRASLRDARLRDVDLFRGSCEEADLSGADATGANLYEVEFLGATLRGTVLRRAQLRMTKLA